MAWLPTARAEVENIAVPVADRVTVASVMLPSRKLTVPVGVPAPGAPALTVAVKVTAWPNTAALAEEITVVLVAGRFAKFCDERMLLLVTIRVSGLALVATKPAGASSCTA